MPKSGTTLVEEILECLPYIRIDRSPMRFFPIKDENIFRNNPEKYFNCFPRNKFSFIKTHNTFDENFLLATNKYNVKIVSAISWELFDMQDSEYKSSYNI